MEKEIWKDIPQYEGYQASSLGRIRSIDREVRHHTGSTFIRKGKVLSQSLGGGNYLRAGILGGSKHVHKLVAMAFLDHVPCGHKLVVDHYPDKTTTNNKLSNLRVTTQRENTSSKRGSSKYTGVSLKSPNGKWRATINVGGKDIFLGSFTNEIDAHNAYQKKLKEIS